MWVSDGAVFFFSLVLVFNFLYFGDMVVYLVLPYSMSPSYLHFFQDSCCLVFFCESRKASTSILAPPPPPRQRNEKEILIRKREGGRGSKQTPTPNYNLVDAGEVIVVDAIRDDHSGFSK